MAEWELQLLSVPEQGGQFFDLAVLLELQASPELTPLQTFVPLRVPGIFEHFALNR